MYRVICKFNEYEEKKNCLMLVLFSLNRHKEDNFIVINSFRFVIAKWMILVMKFMVLKHFSPLWEWVRRMDCCFDHTQ